MLNPDIDVAAEGLHTSGENVAAIKLTNMKKFSNRNIPNVPELVEIGNDDYEA